MVIEHFKDGATTLIGERFQRSGRMLPEGLKYHASWVSTTGDRCFQIMETVHPELLQSWMSRWDDLIDFETVPALNSSEFWAERESARGGESP
jgi:hypothetical protein